MSPRGTRSSRPVSPRAALVPLFAGLAVAGCGRELPPLGEALVVVDTDLPVPQIAGRLRVDVYESGVWIESRELARPDARDWPVSFSVVGKDDGRDHDVMVRLRVFPEGATRSYRGERFQDFATVHRPGAASATPTAGPRLVRDGRDLTPPLEPLPNLAVDRLVALHLVHAERARHTVVLAGACAGEMARLGDEPTTPDVVSATTCKNGVRGPADGGAVDAVLETPTTSRAGTFHAAPCTNELTTKDRVCVPGGAFVLGSRLVDFSPEEPPSPERIVAVSRFVVDRHEVTVARMRDARARGFRGEPEGTEGPMATTVEEACPWSRSAQKREGYAVSCVGFALASGFCAFEGGRLPTEAEWEKAASAGGPRKTRYPAGDTEPSCDEVVYGRVALAGSPGVCARGREKGPVPVFAEDGAPLQESDTSPLGVVGLAGGLGEWTADDYAPYGSEAWTTVTRIDPRVVVAPTAGVVAKKVSRGASWIAPVLYLRSTTRQVTDVDAIFSGLGIRCVYPAP